MSDCFKGNASKDISLSLSPSQVIKGQGAEKWTMGPQSRRRFSVLIIVHIIIFIHIVIWLLSKKYDWFGGKTLTPIEPSESIEFLSDGVVNAGVIFFGLALLFTALFGRWFCGWGCHVVFLQDWCYSILRKRGIRPRPFRSRLIGLVPLFLALYMFAWPPFYRWIWAPVQNIKVPDFHIEQHLLTTDLWETFPGPLIAIPFLFICGFAVVYFLGAKGFCTYGCPYGGFFAPLDKFSPLRIRVTDDCGQCGLCTAACTSNVRVHEQVDVFKAVKDPGCMKTMDCIEACPNDALYIGFGSNGFQAQGKKVSSKWDLSWRFEIALFLFFVISFFSFRGLYSSIPLLMAVGMSLVVTWIGWKCSTLIYKKNVSLHRWILKRNNFTRQGKIFVLISLCVFLFLGHSFFLQSIKWRAVLLTGSRALSVDKNSQEANSLQEEIFSCWRLLQPFWRGGVAFASDPAVELALSRHQVARGEYDQARLHLERASLLANGKGGQQIAMELGWIRQRQDEPEGLNQWYSDMLNKFPQWTNVWLDRIGWLARDVDVGLAWDVSQEAVKFNPKNMQILYQKNMLAERLGREECLSYESWFNKGPKCILYSLVNIEYQLNGWNKSVQSSDEVKKLKVFAETLLHLVFIINRGLGNSEYVSSYKLLQYLKYKFEEGFVAEFFKEQKLINENEIFEEIVLLGNQLGVWIDRVKSAP